MTVYNDRSIPSSQLINRRTPLPELDNASPEDHVREQQVWTVSWPILSGSEPIKKINQW